ncbi:MAG: DUF4007 family protein [Roseovarius sp.]|nr:DUF4007 family protein [Roseovarius sp.]MCY4208416.1 DUF4007 family protein [Roseovarius sp.]MCY4291427.1 DUF4007 family protein [Roseovarius sp.]MCY4315242.1 DUF4007 family protein [Roseovarius sp.]
MKTGGHETFYPRPGWLAKGLQYIMDGEPRFFSQPQSADDLGVGRNMAKSIGWWLVASGLAKRETRNGPLKPSEFGNMVARHDPYMVRLGTWWLLHAAVATSKSGSTLPWFFSPGFPYRCTRTELTELLQNELKSANGKPPSLKAVQRDVAVMMRTYAVPIPRPITDPEDNLGSPFQRLNMWRHMRRLDRFEKSEPTPIPPEAICMVLCALSMGNSAYEIAEGEMIDVDVEDNVMLHCSSIFGLSRDSLLEKLSKGVDALGRKRLDIRNLAGKKYIAVGNVTASGWAATYFENSFEGRRVNAA